MIVCDDITLFVDDKTGAQASLLELPVGHVTPVRLKKSLVGPWSSRTEKVAEGITRHLNRGSGADVHDPGFYLLDKVCERRREIP